MISRKLKIKEEGHKKEKNSTIRSKWIEKKKKMRSGIKVRGQKTKKIEVKDKK